MGNPNTKETGHRYGVQGPQDNPDPHIARQAALREAAEFGMIGLLNTGAGGDPNAPTAPWGRDDSLGNDPMSARGNMWGDSIGDSFGAGGLGLSGIGEGGGGRGEGIGLGSIGTLGHGAGTGTGQGFGSGHGRLGGSHSTRAPQVRMGATPGQRPPPARGHPAHRSPELRSLPPLLRERPAQQPEPPGPRGGPLRHRPRRRGVQREQRRLGPAGCSRRAVRGARVLRPLVPAARRRHRHGRLPDHVLAGRLIALLGPRPVGHFDRQICFCPRRSILRRGEHAEPSLLCAAASNGAGGGAVVGPRAREKSSEISRRKRRSFALDFGGHPLRLGRLKRFGSTRFRVHFAVLRAFEGVRGLDQK